MKVRKNKYGVVVRCSLPSKTDGVESQWHGIWRQMIKRCYSGRPKDINYADCSVSNEWLHDASFKEFYDDNHFYGSHLDKDILDFGNRVYCKESCVFIPGWLNFLITDRARDRGQYPIGVDFHKASGKLRASCNYNGKQKHLGLFTCAVKAHNAWRLFKADVIDISILRLRSENPSIYRLDDIVSALELRAAKLRDLSAPYMLASSPQTPGN